MSGAIRSVAWNRVQSSEISSNSVDDPGRDLGGPRRRIGRHRLGDRPHRMTDAGVLGRIAHLRHDDRQVDDGHRQPCGAMRARIVVAPRMYGCSASGISMVPSGWRYVSTSAAHTRGTARAEPFSVCRIAVPLPSVGR